MAQLVDPSPILPRAITASPNVQSLARYDAALNTALFQALVKIAYRLNSAFMRDGSEAMSGPIVLGSPTELTIASGVITVTSSYHTVDTEADGASDDLDTINGGSDGQILTLRAADDARTVVVKDATGNIQGPGDFSLTHRHDTVQLIYDAALTAWLVVSTSNNTA